MSQDIVGRLTAFAGITPDHPSGGSFLNAPAVALVEEAASVITTLTAERDALRKTNRELHRRVQKSEAVNQSAMAVLQGWIDYFVATVPTGGKKRQERLLFYWAIRDAKKQADKRIAALSRSEV